MQSNLPASGQGVIRDKLMLSEGRRTMPSVCRGQFIHSDVLPVIEPAMIFFDLLLDTTSSAALIDVRLISRFAPTLIFLNLLLHTTSSAALIDVRLICPWMLDWIVEADIYYWFAMDWTMEAVETKRLEKKMTREKIDWIVVVCTYVISISDRTGNKGWRHGRREGYTSVYHGF